MSALDDVKAERARQDARFGEQNHPNGTGRHFADMAREARESCDEEFGHGNGTWQHILSEEVAEAFAESDPVKLRAELVQVAAVACAWIEAIDRRNSK